MPEIGKINKLKVIKELDFGVYLDGAELGGILLPKRYVPHECKTGDDVDVFLYFDSSDRIIATTEKPYATVGDFALMRVKSVDQVGAFLDWGLMKDLLVPFRQQKVNMEEGRSYLVYVYYDQISNRIAASAKLEKFLNAVPADYKVGQQVDLLIWKATDMGYKAIINNSHQGILYSNEIFRTLNTGQCIKGFVKKVRPDNKIDLSLYAEGYDKVGEHTEKIIEYLKQQGGYSDISDKTSPGTIYSLFSISKKTFKSALGDLYKKGLIVLEKDRIRLSDNPETEIGKHSLEHP
ncbi:MAG TPA: S1-like domain-containing RNA-binding protein [Bacteroidales bacterium]|nr:S1-like domain-containing RNA-binding protein [Bacteroidales bacterium]